MLNNLYAQTQLQSSFGINIVALVNNEPRVLNLKQVLEAFIQHRREVVTRRSLYLLRRARVRGHTLEGLTVALSNIDEVIEMIRSSANAAEARERLINTAWKSEILEEMLARAGRDAAKPEEINPRYGMNDAGEYYLSPEQAQAILDMRLNRLTALEQENLLEEYRAVIDDIIDLLDILANPERLLAIIRDELLEIRDEYGDERRTEIIASEEDLTMEDLITEQDMVVTVSNNGYAKTQPIDTYRAQRRGGRGKAASSVKAEDFIPHLMVANSHDTILCFSNTGKVYWQRVFQIPPASRAARGRPLVNILPLEQEERITTFLPVQDYADDKFIFMATGNGTVKKTPLMDFSRPRSTGLIAIELEAGNTLIGAEVTDGHQAIMLFSSAGKAIRFKESDVRAMGRAARGVRGIRLKSGETVNSLIVPQAGGMLLVASESGYGKRMESEDFSVIGRGGQGMISMKLSARNGRVVSAIQTFEGDEMILISDQGTLVRIRAAEVSVQGRNTQGVTLIKLADDESLVGLARVEEPEGDEVSEAEFDDRVGPDDAVEGQPEA